MLVSWRVSSFQRIEKVNSWPVIPDFEEVTMKERALSR